MLKFNAARKFVADFETTVYEGQTETEVWAAASVPVWSEDVSIFNCIDDFLSYHFNKTGNQIVYFHNLKFDGQFILDYLFKHGYKLSSATTVYADMPTRDFSWIRQYKKMPEKSVYVLISNLGQWYMMAVNTGHSIIEFRDSLKLLPFSVEVIGESFKTKHRKLSIEYEGVRHASGIITEEEKQYIKNDVLVVAEALAEMFAEGHTDLTIGSCCMREFKDLWKHKKNPKNPLAHLEYGVIFPDLTKVTLDFDTYGSYTADEYMRKSYHGGWCYVVDWCKGKTIKRNGCTADVNSLYPSRMHSSGGCQYPFGLPTFWTGEIPENAKKKYYFVRFRCRFEIKDGFLPFVQIKNSFLYKHNEYLKTSDYCVNGHYTRFLRGKDGILMDSWNEYTMTCTDFEMFKKHYNIYDLKILDGCYFSTEIGIFDDYIDKYMEIKLKSKGAKRTIAKLFLNNLYGKFATSDNSSYQVPVMFGDTVEFFTVKENDKKVGYIPVGSAITSYAREFTITAAQKNYYGEGKPGFKYADTDSIHCDLEPDEIEGITIHDKNFNCWKIENCWDAAKFLRQKTYIEHTTKEDLELVKPYYLIKCAGMNKDCKELLNASITQDFSKLDLDKLDTTQKDFVKTKRTLADFKEGLEIFGKLLPKKIPGGVILEKTTFKIR